MAQRWHAGYLHHKAMHSHETKVQTDYYFDRGKCARYKLELELAQEVTLSLLNPTTLSVHISNQSLGIKFSSPAIKSLEWLNCDIKGNGEFSQRACIPWRNRQLGRKLSEEFLH